MKNLFRASLLAFFLSFFVVSSLLAQSSEGRFRSLDSAIESWQEHIEKKESRIAEFQKTAAAAKTDEQKFDAWQNLYYELSTFNSEKACEALEQCRLAAEKLQKTDTAKRMFVLTAYQKALEGRYDEALKRLEKIDRSEMSQSTTASFLFVRNFIYDKMAVGEKDAEKAAAWREKVAQGSEEYAAIAEKTSPFYYQQKVMGLLSAGKLTEATNTCDIWESKVKRGTSDYALMARYMAVSTRNDSKRQMPWLVTAARSEVTSGMMSGDAMRALAALLEKRGDNARAARYAEVAKQMRANFLAATAPAQEEKADTTATDSAKAPIAKAEKKEPAKVEEKKDTGEAESATPIYILILLAVFVILTLLCALAVVKLRRQVEFAEGRLLEAANAMAAMKLELNKKDSELKRAEEDKKTLTAPPPAPEPEKVIVKVVDETKVQKLQKEVDRLKRLTTDVESIIREANRSKELVPMMVSFCAKYLTAEQMEEVYTRFDTIVLKHYPRFAIEFNSLLQEEHRQIPDEAQALTTEMRMAALIRFGIDSSALIADFLHLSANTVYNYRARLRSKALGDRDSFEERITEIGR